MSWTPGDGAKKLVLNVLNWIISSLRQSIESNTNNRFRYIMMYIVYESMCMCTFVFFLELLFCEICCTMLVGCKPDAVNVKLTKIFVEDLV